MAAIQTLSHLDAARQRFQRSKNRIRGSGSFALVSRCTMPWTINLYQTAEERAAALDRWGWNKCMATTCAHDHICVNL